MIDIDGCHAFERSHQRRIIAIAHADGGVKILPGGALSFSSNLKLKV